MKNKTDLFKDKEVVKDFTRFYKGEPTESTPLPLKEISKAIDTVKSRDLDVVLYLNYLKHKKKLLESLEEYNSWTLITTKVVEDTTTYKQEAFVDLLEEKFKTKVETGAKIVELIGADVEEEVINTLNYVTLNSRLNKYGRALGYKLSTGGSYKDLLDIDLKPYRITPEQRKESKVVELAIRLSFRLYEDLTTAPSLKKVSKEIKAPYSVLMDAYTISK